MFANLALDKQAQLLLCLGCRNTQPLLIFALVVSWTGREAATMASAREVIHVVFGCAL